ncbi:MAG: ImmA/IrrE family metallo-endopeptidase [Proteobacteria bacterium]|nr:ImmA/IrrE family metallo-endopeptidase [Pseudomonadota bacterium]MCP4920700.1 ImmA/IrrE family metallo-endopeptidase [Pseudomonadota bacterium]
MTGPICIWDVVQDSRLGLSTVLMACASMEGLYSHPERMIIVTSLRPPGRRAFSCAHELGHAIFAHGTRVDQLGERPEEHSDPDEFIADSFADSFLMPSVTVRASLARRSLDPARLTPEDAYELANAYGVGFTTMVGYLAATLRVLPWRRAQELRRIRPKAIQQGLLPALTPRRRVISVSAAWERATVDAEVGDYICFRGKLRLPAGNVAVAVSGTAALATRPGSVGLDAGGQGLLLRVQRRGFAGRVEHRHKTDPEFEDERCCV